MEVNGEIQHNRDPEPPDVLDIDESPLPATQKQPSAFRRQLSQYSATLVVNFLAFCYGISVAWGSTALPVLQSEDTPLSSGPASDMDKAWLSSSLCLMAFFGVPIFSVLCAKCSRKLVGYIVASVHLTSWIITSFTDSLVLVYIARFLTGIGAGASLLYVPLYVSEIAEDNIRGTLGCLFVFIINSGILFGYIIGSYVPYYTQAIIYTAIPATFMILFFTFPDTPFYLLRKKTTSEAIAALKKLRGGDNYDTTEEISMLKESLGSAKSNISVKKMFSSRGIVRGMVLALTLCINQQLSGILAILSFTVEIFQESGSSISPAVASIIVGILQLFGTFLSCIFVERYGRKILLLVSNSMVVFELGTLGIYFYLKSINVDVSWWSWYPLKCLSSYIMFFSVGLGPLPFLIMTELLPVQVRSIGASVALCSLWGVGFIAVLVFNPMATALGPHGCYWFFTGCCILGTIFVVLFIPETKGRKIEEITDDLNYGSWIIGRKKTVDINPVS